MSPRALIVNVVVIRVVDLSHEILRNNGIKNNEKNEWEDEEHQDNEDKISSGPHLLSLRQTDWDDAVVKVLGVLVLCDPSDGAANSQEQTDICELFCRTLQDLLAVANQ